MIVRVNYEQCDAIVRRIKELGGFPEDREDPIPMRLGKATLGMVNLAAVAINHQTTPLTGRSLVGLIDGKTARGWDYLWRRLLQLAEEEPRIVSPLSLSRMSAERLASLLKDGYDGGLVSDIERRAAYLTDIGCVMQREGWETADDLHASADGYLRRTEGPGLHQLLKTFKAYASDPLEKKSNYFLALQRNSVGWQYRDPENLEAPVNYHEERGHLRAGMVEILDRELAHRVRRRLPVTAEEDLAIRGAVKQALAYTAGRLQMTPAAMHYACWNHFRNCCGRDNTHCSSCGGSCALPERYKVLGVASCIFAPVCPSKGKPVADILLEASFDTDWY